MYFAFGWPKFFSTGAFGPIVDIKYNSDCSLVACLTHNSVILWSGDQNRIRLGQSIRKEDSVQTTGVNTALCWAPDSSLLAVITSGGHIYLYVVSKEWQDPLEFTYVQPHHIPYSLSTPTTKLLHVSLASSFLVAHGGASSLCGEGEMLYLVTKNNYIVVMRWTGDIAEQFSISDVIFLDSPITIYAALHDLLLMNGDDSNKGHSTDGIPMKLPQLPPSSIAQFTYAPTIHTFCLVLANGSVVVMQAKPATAPLVTRLRAYFLMAPAQSPGVGKAVCASVNACYHLAAIGCDNGDVKLYKIPLLFLHTSVLSSNLLPKSQLQSMPPQQKFQPPQPDASEQIQTQCIEPQGAPKIGSARVFTLLHWGIKGDDTGPVAIVTWTRYAKMMLI